MRCQIVHLKDKYCSSDILFGVGYITEISDTGKIQVHFDNGSGGFFDRSFIYKEGKRTWTWQQVETHLLNAGYKKEEFTGMYKSIYKWTYPDGKVHYEEQTSSLPQEVVINAYYNRIIDFLDIKKA